jgi:hypothetical protein
VIRRKAIKKIFTTTLAMFIILTIYTIPTIKNNTNVLRTNLEITNTSNLSNGYIYLLNKDNLLVKTNIYLEGTTTIDKVKSIVNYLTITNDNLPSNLNNYLPKSTEINDLSIKDKVLSIDFSSEFTNYSSSNERVIITGLVYSILELKQIESINLTVNNNQLSNYQNPLTKNIGINNKYLFTNRNNINKVVVYYYDNTDNYNLIPMTKYLNDNREKIEIIIDELKNTENEDIISLLNYNTKLISYTEESNVMFLNFNEYLLDNDENITKKILNVIAYSVFDNYDVNMVMFEIDDKNIDFVKKNARK